MAAPALYPDVAAIHVHATDIYGNCQVRGITISDLDIAKSAKNCMSYNFFVDKLIIVLYQCRQNN